MANKSEPHDNGSEGPHPSQIKTDLELFDVVDRNYNGVLILHNEPSSVRKVIVLDSAAVVTGVVGWVLVKGPGAYLEAMAKRLGERHADTVPQKLRLLLLESRSRGRELSMIFDPEDEDITFTVQREELTDAAWLALLELIPTMGNVGGAVLEWDAEAAQWRTREPSECQPCQDDRFGQCIECE
jgi:hypothetical protein